MDNLDQRNSHALDLAIELAGSRAALARITGVSKPAAYKWTRIPAQHCRRLEKHFDGALTRYEMRPDIFGAGSEAQAA